MTNPFQNQKIIELVSEYKNIWALEYLSNLAGWDIEVCMPKNGASDQGEALSKAASLIQSFYLNDKFLELYESAKSQSDLNDSEKAVLRVVGQSIDSFKKFPKEFVEEFSREVTQSQVAWSKAKLNNDFEYFAPHLEKIVELTIRKADYKGFKNDRYDALVDDYEFGLTTQEIKDYFESIKPFLKDLLSYIKSSPKFIKQHPLELVKYDRTKLEALNSKILNMLGTGNEVLRLDVSSHPFTQGFSPSHARITTWYHDADIRKNLAATLHEYGHALFEIQCDPALAYSPIVGAESLGLHESQSRFWENFVCRSKPFLKLIYGDLLELSPEFKNYTVDDFYFYFNRVNPDLIRVEADEVTYHFHIMIRFEMEQMLLNKEITVREAPKVWNAKYKEYLGVEPTDFRTGILQDIHWSGGSIGYFPTYSTGTVLSAMWKEKLESELGSIDSLILSDGGFSKIKEWLKINIHQYGSTYTFNELVSKQLSKSFNADSWKKYLEYKYKELY